jgi:hypothetical protein
MSDAEWERAYRRLEQKLDAKIKAYDLLERKVWALEAEVKRLIPFEKAAERQYDSWTRNKEQP